MKVEKIKYPMGALTAEGALIYDETISAKRPAVLMAPNWMGMTDAAIERGKLVAGDRYVVFVADMYGQGTRPADFGAAATLANPLRENAAEQRKRIRAAYDAMIAEAAKRNLIDGRRAAIGFCFGGGNVLELARDGADIAAAVSIHGDLKTAASGEERRGESKAPGHAWRARSGRAQGRPRRFRKRNGCGRRQMADAGLLRRLSRLYRPGFGRARRGGLG